DVVFFALHGARQAAGEGSVGVNDRVALTAELGIQIFCLHAPDRSELPLDARTDRPTHGRMVREACGGALVLEGHNTSRALCSTGESGLSVGETARTVPKQVRRREPTKSCPDCSEVIELVFVHRGKAARTREGRSDHGHRTRAAVCGGPLEVGLDTPYPARVD